MTLVLPAGCSSSHTCCSKLLCSSPTASSQHSGHHNLKALASGGTFNMPCMFDEECMDFESSLLSAALNSEDWPAYLREIPSNNSATSSPNLPTSTLISTTDTQTNGGGGQQGVVSASSEVVYQPHQDLVSSAASVPSSAPGGLSSATGSAKRKVLSTVNQDDPIAKRLRSSAVVESSLCSASAKIVVSSSAASEENGKSGGDEDLFCVRRRMQLLWSPTQKLKDERRKVLKISLNKLRCIEDPEMFLRRSVLINNTAKRLQQEIRDEKMSKHQHLQNSISARNGSTPGSDVVFNGVATSRINGCTGDGTVDGGSATTLVTNGHSATNSNTTTRSWGFDTQPEDGYPKKTSAKVLQTASTTSVQTSSSSTDNATSSDESDEGASCADMYGVTEDVLHIPQLFTEKKSDFPSRTETPIPSENGEDNVSSNNSKCCKCSSEQSDSRLTDSNCKCCDECNNLLPNQQQQHDNERRIAQNGTSTMPNSSTSTANTSSNSILENCGRQFRTAGQDSTALSESGPYARGLSVLDSVVYHSLLASLES